MREMVTALIRSNPRSASTGDTLLHLCVSRLNTIKSAYFSDDNQVCKKKIHFLVHTKLNLPFPLHCCTLLPNAEDENDFLFSNKSS